MSCTDKIVKDTELFDRRSSSGFDLRLLTSLLLTASVVIFIFFYILSQKQIDNAYRGS